MLLGAFFAVEAILKLVSESLDFSNELHLTADLTAHKITLSGSLDWTLARLAVTNSLHGLRAHAFGVDLLGTTRCSDANGHNAAHPRHPAHNFTPNCHVDPPIGTHAPLMNQVC